VSWADAVGDDPVAVLPLDAVPTRVPARWAAGAARGRAGQILATWPKDSSTGVSRPKMETSTLSFWLSALISEIVAGRVSKGPSVTVTD
jgi:hypothetical protein